MDKQDRILWVDEQTDRQIGYFFYGGQTDGHRNRLFFKIDEQTDKETARQTELRNCYIDLKGHLNPNTRVFEIRSIVISEFLFPTNLQIARTSCAMIHIR